MLKILFPIDATNFLGSKYSLTDIPDTTAARKTASTIIHISIIARISCENINQYNVTCYWDIYLVLSLRGNAINVINKCRIVQYPLKLAQQYQV